MAEWKSYSSIKCTIQHWKQNYFKHILIGKTCNFILLTIWIIVFFIFHLAHFGILYLLQYEKSIFSMSLFFCPLHSMVYFYFIVAKIWKKNLSNVPSCNSITMILLYLLQYYFLYFIVVSKRNKQLQVDTIANIELSFN